MVLGVKDIAVFAGATDGPLVTMFAIKIMSSNNKFASAFVAYAAAVVFCTNVV